MNWRDFIEIRPDTMVGKPVIKGTRITVEHILERLGNNWTTELLLDSHPHLKAEDIRAAQLYASHALSTDEIHFLNEQRVSLG